MSRQNLFQKVLIGILIFALAGSGVAAVIFARLPQTVSPLETIVLGSSQLVPGSQAAVRVLVRDSRNSSPLADAAVEVAMRPRSGGPEIPLYQGKTDSQGSLGVAFTVPADVAREQTLVVHTTSTLGEATLERPVTVERQYRIYLTSDKPIYQPGQTIHLRALALSAFDLLPAAEQTLEITIADGRGNKVFRQSLTTSAYGSAAVDFQLADQVNTGDYKITASLGGVSSEKTVSVEHYVLPKFNITLQTDKAYYQPGQHVTGTLQADYFYGKPIANGEVRIEGFTFDVEKVVQVTLQGETDESGNFNFEFDLPSYIAGSEYEGGMARFYLQALVTDQAAHAESADLSLPVAGSSLMVDAVPEGGKFYPGIENILYALVSYPDGTPAQADLTLTLYDTGQTLTAQTGPYGLAEFRFTPQSSWMSFRIDARDTAGSASGRDFYFDGTWMEESLLLRTDQPVYRVGDTMQVTVLASSPAGTVYLDIVREGQTVSTRSLPLENGQAQAAIDLTPDLYGTLEVHAYKILSSGAIVRDTRLVVVDQANQLTVSLTPGQDTYLPGDDALLNIQVQDSAGNGVQSMLGLAIVDEAVFALAEQDPGFARLYFLLEQEILTPRYDLHGFSIPDLAAGLPSADPALQSAVEGAARASLASALSSVGGFSLQGNSRQEAVQAALSRQSRFFNSFTNFLYAIFFAIPFAMLVISGASASRQKRLGYSLLLAAGIVIVLWAVIIIWQNAFRYSGWQPTLLDRLMDFFYAFLSYRGNGTLLLIALFGLFGLIASIILAVRHKYTGLGWLIILSLLFSAVTVAMLYSSSLGSVSIAQSAMLGAVLAFAVALFSIILRSAAFFLEKRALAGVALLGLAGLLLLGTSIPISFATSAMAKNEVMRGIGGEVIFEEAVMAAPMAPAPTAAAAMDGAEQSAGAASSQQPPRLRQYFPETLLWLPDALTDPSGSLQVDFTAADSITTWRVTVLASTQDGQLGSANAPLRVFQDFFIDIDLPLSLTVGDQVSIPIGVFNYLPQEQTVRLELQQQDWFELQDDPVKEMTIPANDISVVYFTVKARDFGMQPFQVTGWGSVMSDAVRREVHVYPDGKPIAFSISDRLQPGSPVSQQVLIPQGSVPGTQQLMVKIYPGMVSQVIEGLESILRMPYGCFEQTSSTTYPNVLVMDYLQQTGQSSPEVQFKAEEYINLGYQRLLTFEVDGGGFSLFGDAPADRMLTAYGLQEFADMSRVHNVDPALIQRAADWLLAQQSSDGSWENDRGLVHESTWSNLGNDRLPVTAYITWSLLEAGFADRAGVSSGLDYLREFQSQADDPYSLALIANALVAGDLAGSGSISTSTQTALDRLAGMAQTDGSGTYWQSGIATMMGSQGSTASVETTALAAIVFQKVDQHPELVRGALTYIIRSKDPAGTWYTTQATVLSLKALLQSLGNDAENTNVAVTITLNGGQTRSVQVTPENFDVVQLISFDDINIGAANTVQITAQGTGSLMYQITGSYYLPWELAEVQDTAAGQPADIQVVYDRSELSVDDTVAVTVTVTLTEPGSRAESAMIDLGLPPGFTLQSEDLSALVNYYNDTPEDYALPTIERYELTGRQILIYTRNLSAEHPLTFTYHLRARFPLRVQAPASQTYDYYNPDVAGEQAPQMLVVNP